MEEIVLCQNCGEELPIGTKYCPYCGQKKILKEDYRFGRMLKESIFDFFHIDAKLFSSLFPILLRPGYLTKQWLAGKHMKYFKPFKMFLFISILYFILVAVNEHYLIKWGASDQRNTKSIFEFDFRNVPEKNNNPTYEIDLPEEPPTYMDRQSEKFDKMGDEKITEYFTKNISKMIILLIPVVALLLKLIYIRKKKIFYEHLIFTLHIHSFVFLFAIIIELIILTTGYLLEWWIAIPLILIYVFLALKHVYRQKFLMTLVSNLMLWIGYIGIAVPLLIIITVLVSIAIV
ncbi:DUF3667 domain-containing protein [bacterium]|nr:MAG: DUF3667 domain-containing protein [bacterium]